MICAQPMGQKLRGSGAPPVRSMAPAGTRPWPSWGEWRSVEKAGAVKPFRWIAVGALLAFAGCEVGAAAYFMSRGDKSSDGSAVVVAPPTFKTWIAHIPDNNAADLEHAALIALDGKPGPTWTELGNAEATFIFDPAADPASINAILIQASSTQDYEIDSIEILDDQGRVIEHASGPTWSNLVNSPNSMKGPPDGDPAVTVAVGDVRAFIFTLYSEPIDRFRINGRPPTSAPALGDVVAVGGYSSGFDERPGGMAIDANGLIHLTLSVSNTVRLLRYGLDGNLVDDVQIETGITTSVGSHSVALDSSGEIFTASTILDGRVRVRQYHPNLSVGWSRTFFSGHTSDRVEANGIAVDESGDVVVAGAMNSPSGLEYWQAKVAGVDGSDIFDSTFGGGPGATYWHGVATGPGNLIYATGTTDFLNVIQGLIIRFSPDGAFEWFDIFGNSAPLEDVGRTVALDSAGNLFVAGSLGTAAEGRNSVLIRYGTDEFLPAATTFNGLANGDDEILDISADTDGSIYAVGYETVSGQGENIWVRKYDANLNPVWTRTHDGGVGNDRAISAAIHGDQLVVAGYQTVTGGQTKFVLRVYAK